MERLETHFVCHHAWKVAETAQAEFIARVSPRIRGVLTVGQIGLDTALMDLLPRLEIVAINSVGIDKIDLGHLRERGIRATNTPGVLTDDVADLGVLLLLAASRRLVMLDRYVRTAAWERSVPLEPSRSVKGKVAGIFGFGRIGQALAVRLHAMGMQLRYFQPRPIADTDIPRATSLLELARQSDYLILCAPATEKTRGVIDGPVMAALGPQGTLINIARGSLVDEIALIRALQQGDLGAAALDVFGQEPIVPLGLQNMDNVILTPHVGSLTVETRNAMGQLTVENLLAHFRGEALLTPLC